MLQVGDEAPDFTLTDENGDPVTLSNFRGREAVVLVFYPGDGTPVCTAQLCEIRDAYADFTAAGVRAFGINPFSRAGKQRFSRLNHFPFRLLADPGRAVARLYGCDIGFGFLGFNRRAVYGIDRAGRIAFAQQGRPDPAAVLRALAGS
jgi:peroxiredoxin Q/BCP